MVTVLKSLSAAAMLTPAEASEEFRHGVVRCLKASFLSLQSCGDPSCRCSASWSPPQHGYGDGCNFYAEHVWTRCFAVSQTRNSENIEACHVAYLQSDDMRVAIGHLFSVLLKVSHSLPTYTRFIFLDTYFAYGSKRYAVLASDVCVLLSSCPFSADCRDGSQSRRCGQCKIES